MAHPPAEPLVLSADERRSLEGIAASPSLPYRAVREAKGLLMAADGVANTEIAECLEVSRSTVLGWRKGFAEHGVDWVGKVRPGRGPKPTIGQDRIEQMVHATLHTRPPDGSTHWSVRSMAKHSGLSKSTVQKVWHARKIYAAPGRDLRAVQRQALRREARRRGRLVPQPAGGLGGAVSRRKEPDPGAQPHPAEPAHEAGADGHDDPRLQAQRHHDAVRRLERLDGGAPVQLHAPPPKRRVLEVPAPHRPQHRKG